jgi:hypothetical protein
MRVVELCFHERDARAAEMAARGLEAAGVCVLRRPVSGKHIPAPSPAARERVLLHSDYFATLPDDYAAADTRPIATVAVPVGQHWPRRASRPWLMAPPTQRLDRAEFWKAVVWAASQPIPTPQARLAAQRLLLRRLSMLTPGPIVAPRRRSWRDIVELGHGRGKRWGGTAAVAALLAVVAFASVLAVDIAARPEAWSAIAQTSGVRSD